MRAATGGLIEREVEIGRLRSLLADADQRSPAVAVITGPAGAGKSRLAAATAALADADGWLVLEGNCTPATGGRLAYGPVVDLLTDLISTVPDLRATVTDQVWHAVAALVAGTDAADGDLGALATTRLLASIVDVFSTVSTGRPTLIVIEDLHWADPASLDLFGFLARKLLEQRLVLILTVRTGGGRVPAVQRTLAEIARLATATEIALAPLSGGGVRTLVDSLGLPLAAQQIDRIVTLSDGNPFYAMQLARHGNRQGLPPALSDVLLAALAEQGPVARELLLLLHVSGTELDSAQLAAALAIGQEALTAATRSLVGAGLIDVDGTQLRLAHSLIAEAIESDILPSERILAHIRAAEALIAAGADRIPARATELARHLLGCGRTVQAVRYALIGAEYATDSWVFAEARDDLAAVLRLWPVLEDPESAAGCRRADIVLRLAEAHRWCGEYTEALRLIDAALGDPSDPATGPFRLARARTLDAMGHLRAARDDYAAALRLGAPAEPGSVLAALARTHAMMGDADDADRLATQAIAEAQRVGAETVRLDATITLAVADAQRGRVESAREILARCADDVRRRDRLEVTLRFYGNLTFVLGIAGRPAEVAVAAEQGLHECRRYGPISSLISSIVCNQVAALMSLGRWDDATRSAVEALAEPTSPTMAAYLHTELAAICVARGQWAAADAHLDAAGEPGTDNPYALEQIFVRADRAMWSGHPEDAVRLIVGILPVLQDQADAAVGLDACRFGLRACADAAERTGRSTLVGALVRDADEISSVANAFADHQSGHALSETLTLACSAERSRLTSSDTAAEWVELADREAALGRRPEQAYALFRVGSAHVRDRALGPARAALTAAARLGRELGAPPLVAMIQDLARIARLDLAEPEPRSVPPHRPSGLTEREWDVLGSLADGLTNRAIAGRLFISERTVGVHVSRILAKLGVANRTEAARLAIAMSTARSG